MSQRVALVTGASRGIGRQLCIDLKVLGLPTFIVFRDGDQVARLTRSMISDQELTDWVTATVSR